MFDNMFNIIEPMVDQDIFIAQVEEILEHPEGIQGNPYELHLLLKRLKSGNMSFEDFLAQAKAWVQTE
jgi:hypothetical protein